MEKRKETHMKEELLKGLTAEQAAKVKACKNQEEILKLAKEEGIELNDEQLEAVSGGCSDPHKGKCPKCGTECTRFVDGNSGRALYNCPKCGSVLW